MNYMSSFYEQPPERRCLQCDKLLFGREDKRFCNDTCRNTFNRRKQKVRAIEDEPYVRQVFKTIRKNYEILRRMAMLREFPCTISRHVLIEYGFHFKFFTSIRKQKDGSIYYFCFEYGWKELGDHKLVLVDNYEQVDI